MSVQEEKPTLEDEVTEIDYEVVSISKFEFMIYLTYWMGCLVAGCYSVYITVNRRETVKYFIKNGYIKKTYFGLYQSQHEYSWMDTTVMINEGTKYFAAYILFSKLLRAYTSPMVFSTGCVVLTMAINYHLSSLKFLAFECLILTLPSIAGLLRLKALVWILGLLLLYHMKDYGTYDFFHESYIVSMAFSYTALLITRAITVGLTVADAPKYTMRLFVEMNLYYWYFPAIIGCRMMTVKEFIANIYKPYVIQNLKGWLFHFFRIMLWYQIWNIITTLVPIYLVLITHDIKSLNAFIVIGGQLFYGIHFGMVYIIIYNLVYLVSQLDGFLTAEGPVCISHVSLYSQMWRGFDVGLHIWIKDHIFRPIIKMGSFHKTKIIAANASFGFVIIFHGLSKDTVLWIFLNVVQFFVHHYLIYVFNRTTFGSVMQRTFSARLNRRFIAMAGAISWIMSVYGFGSFSYGLDKNNQMYMTLLKKDSNFLYYRLITFCTLAYCHAEMALTVNAYMAKRKKNV